MPATREASPSSSIPKKVTGTGCSTTHMCFSYVAQPSSQSLFTLKSATRRPPSRMPPCSGTTSQPTMKQSTRSCTCPVTVAPRSRTATSIATPVIQMDQARWYLQLRVDPLQDRPGQQNLYQRRSNQAVRRKSRLAHTGPVRRYPERRESLMDLLRAGSGPPARPAGELREECLWSFVWSPRARP